MAQVRAFKGFRPASSELAQKTAALPYDVLTSAEARQAAKDNPYSFLHVDKAEIDLEEGTDIYDSRVYKKAAENLNRMIEDKIYIQDKAPVLYIYRLTMNGRSQTGLVGCTSVDDYLNGVIKRHELTREEKEQDRIRHVDECNANTGPIFLTYKARTETDGIINKYTEENEPVYDFVSEDNIMHTVWVIDSPSVINSIEEGFKRVDSLYIADGHHRNASAVKVGLKRRQEMGSNNPDDEYNYYLSVIFPDNQLHIMDYNRIVMDLNSLSREEFFAETEKCFEIGEYKKEGCFKPDKPHTFGMYIDKKWYVLKARPEIINEKDPVEGLDVSILQNRLLHPILGINDPRTDKRIDFIGGIRGLDELVKMVDSGKWTVAFSMYPTSMEQLISVADSGKIMPPKSTWFEPKLRSGIFIHKLD